MDRLIAYPYFKSLLKHQLCFSLLLLCLYYINFNIHIQLSFKILATTLIIKFRYDNLHSPLPLIIILQKPKRG